MVSDNIHARKIVCVRNVHFLNFILQDILLWYSIISTIFLERYADVELRLPNVITSPGWRSVQRNVPKICCFFTGQNSQQTRFSLKMHMVTWKGTKNEFNNQKLGAIWLQFRYSASSSALCCVKLRTSDATNTCFFYRKYTVLVGTQTLQVLCIIHHWVYSVWTTW